MGWGVTEWKLLDGHNYYIEDGSGTVSLQDWNIGVTLYKQDGNITNDVPTRLMMTYEQ